MAAKEKMTRLRFEREKRGWSQAKLYELTGISQADMSQLERGLKVLHKGWAERLSKVYGVPADELMKEVKAKPSRSGR